MTEISVSQARSLAMDAIAKIAREQDFGEFIVLDEAVVETPAAWYFPYDATAFVVDGEISAALAGNLPVRVARDGSGITFEEPRAKALSSIRRTSPQLHQRGADDVEHVARTNQPDSLRCDIHAGDHR